MVAVSDTGTGMTPDILLRAFDPFFTTKPVDKGTGLGLSMVYGFMKQSGGHVTLYSEPGRGTTVRLYLPRSLSLGEPPAQNEILQAPAARGQAEIVLLVEDNPDMQQVTVRLLTDLGYCVVTADNAEQAIARLDHGLRPNLLLTDVLMPGTMDGVALAQYVVTRQPGIRVLLSSGFAERLAADVGRSKGSNMRFSLLSKPYQKHVLASAVRATLDSSVTYQEEHGRESHDRH